MKLSKLALKRWAANPVLCWAPFTVPVLYLALILALEPPDRLEFHNWLYDDHDHVAMALRGLNAGLGRAPGRVDEPADASSTSEFARELDRVRPLQRRYFLEYPHAALLVFRLPYLFLPPVRDWDVPAGVLDCPQLDLIRHDPRQQRVRPEYMLSAEDYKPYPPDKEQSLWRHFRRAVQTYQVVMVLSLLALMAVLRVGYQPGVRLAGPVGLLLLPGALYFTANRFDIIPALLMALSLACVGRHRVVASALLLGAATMVKVYPLLLVPLMVRYLSDNRRNIVAWTAAYGCTVAAFLLVPLLLWGWQGMVGPYQFQMSRRLIPFGTIYGVVVDMNLAGHDVRSLAFRLGSVLVAGLGLAVTRPRDLEGLLRRAAVVLIVFMSIQVFYSPQWILWLSPLLLPLARQQLLLIPLVIALDIATYLSFPLFWPEDWRIMVWIRVATLLALVLLLLWTEFVGRRRRS